MTHYGCIETSRLALETEIMMAMPKAAALITTEEAGGTVDALLQT